MLFYLPKFLRKSKVVQDIVNTYSIQIEYIDNDIEDIRKQLNLDTATWLLNFLELEYGIPINVNKPLEERRSAIKAKMRGTGIVNLELIQAVADSWKNGKCTVDFDRDGTIKLTFNGEYGVPENIEELIDSIDRVKPAHLGLTFQFMYFLVEDVHGMVIDDLEQQLIENFAFENFRR